MEKALNKKTNWFKSIPWYGIVAGLVFILGFQTFMYCFGDQWTKHVGIFKGFDPQVPEIDGRIPLVPYVFVQFYDLWHVLFPIGAIIASAKITQRDNKRQWINLMIAWMSAIFVGGMILIFCPTYIDRLNVAGVPEGNIYIYSKDKPGWSWWILRKWWVHKDKLRLYGEMPSFHCLQIIFCYLAVARRKDKHLAHRIGWLFIAIMICLSTVFVKQHYIMDVVTALAIALISFFVVRSFDPGRVILKKCPNFLIVKKLNWSHEKIYKRVKK